VVSLDRSDIILLQENSGVGEVVKVRLESWFSGWSFETLDVRGRFVGLAIGWNDRSVKLHNSWGMDSVLGMQCSALDLGEALTVFNVYGPYLNWIPFWDSLLSNSLLRGDSVILGGDLNFSLGQSEVWGPRARTDSLFGFFT
jgi:hypothetical protein